MFYFFIYKNFLWLELNAHRHSVILAMFYSCVKIRCCKLLIVSVLFAVLFSIKIKLLFSIEKFKTIVKIHFCDTNRTIRNVKFYENKYKTTFSQH